jgi:hypothetical protein
MPRAVPFDRYGTHDVLGIIDVSKPQPDSREPRASMTSNEILTTAAPAADVVAEVGTFGPTEVER